MERMQRQKSPVSDRTPGRPRRDSRNVIPSQWADHRSVDSYQKKVARLLSFIAEEVLSKKPDDPIDHLMCEFLGFPFSGESTNAASHHSARNSRNVFAEVSLTQHLRPCCVYELRNPFLATAGPNVPLSGVLSSFFESVSCNLIAICGDPCMCPCYPQGNTGCTITNPAGCSCSGSGKSFLCSYLENAGQFLHHRSVISVSIGNVDAFMKGLEDEFNSKSDELYDDIPSVKTSPCAVSLPTNAMGEGDAGAAPCSAEPVESPTLLLLDHVEPPHALLHQLVAKGYFNISHHLHHNGRRVAPRKAIVFTRPQYFYAFPIPCPVYFLRREPGEAHLTTADSGGKRHANLSVSPVVNIPKAASFTFLVGVANNTDYSANETTPATSPAPSGRTRRQRKEISFGAPPPASGGAPPASPGCEESPRSLPMRCIFHQKKFDDETLSKIVSELQDVIRHVLERGVGASPWVPISLSMSRTFRQLRCSRCCVENALGEYFVRNKIVPHLDLSEFPLLMRQIARHVTTEYLLHFFTECTARQPNSLQPANGRIAMGNLVTLLSFCQQWMSPAQLPATVSDALASYLTIPTTKNLFGSFRSTGRATPPNALGDRRIRVVSFNKNNPDPSTGLTGPDDDPFPTQMCQSDSTSTPTHSTARPSDAFMDNAVMGSPCFLKEHLETNAYLHLQNLVLQDSQALNALTQNFYLAAKRAVDARCTDMKPETLARVVLATAATPSHRKQQQLPQFNRTTMSEGESVDGIISSVSSFSSSGCSSFYTKNIAHPILLQRDATEIGASAFGLGANAVLTTPPTSSVDNCFIYEQYCDTSQCQTTVGCNEGLYGLFIVEKHRVHSQLHFAPVETQVQPLYEICFSRQVYVVSSALYYPHQEFHDDGEVVAALLLSDGSCMVVSLCRIARGTSFAYERPPSPPPEEGDGDSSSCTCTDGDLGNDSFTDHSPPCIGCTAECDNTPLTTGAQDDRIVHNKYLTTLLYGAASVYSTRTTKCEDPYIAAISASFVAVAGEDSDIVTVIPHYYRPQLSQTWTDCVEGECTILLCESNVTAMDFLGDNFLAVAVEGGGVQLFSLEADNLGKELDVQDHHESRINVVCSIPQNPFFNESTSPKNQTAKSSARTGKIPRLRTRQLFITGSEDTTMAIFSAYDGQIVRGMRFHSSAVIDITAQCVQSSGTLISLDRTGCVVVSSIDPSDLTVRGRILWRATFSAIRRTEVSKDGSWLVLTRTGKNPCLAIPIAEWCAHGIGQFHSGGVLVVHISPCEQFLFTGGAEGLVLVWNLLDAAKLLLCFREHSSPIQSISCSSSGNRVISSDAGKNIFLWNRQDGEIIRIIERSKGGFTSFIPPYDFIVTSIPEKGVKIIDDEGKLFSLNPSIEATCFDSYFISEDEVSLFANIKKPPPTTAGDSASSSTSPSSTPPNTGTLDAPMPLDPRQRIAGAASPAAIRTHNQQHMFDRCLVAFGIANPHAEYYAVHIYNIGDLRTPLIELHTGEIEDDYGSDDEEIQHSDTIKAFSFLSSLKPQQESKNSPLLHLAASGADDLSVILWNWRKKETLCHLQHTHFVAAVRFFYFDRSVLEHLRQMNVKGDFDIPITDDIVTYLCTSQSADKENISLRLFAVRRVPPRRSYGAQSYLTKDNFAYSHLQVQPVNEIVMKNGSITSFAIRYSDGLICTGNDSAPEVVMYKWVESSATWGMLFPALPSMNGGGGAVADSALSSLSTVENKSPTPTSSAPNQTFDRTPTSPDRRISQCYSETCIATVSGLKPLRHLVNTT